MDAAYMATLQDGCFVVEDGSITYLSYDDLDMVAVDVDKKARQIIDVGFMRGLEFTEINPLR